MSSIQEITGIQVAGRSFHPAVQATFEQDLYVMSVVKAAGLSDLAKNVDLKSETLAAVAENVILTAYTSGKLFELLGAMLEEDGKSWSIPSAQANAKFFAEIRTQEDKLALRSGLAAVILGFFVSGLLSSRTSQVSLSPNVPDADSKDSAGVSPEPQAEGPSITANGTELSESSLGTTLERLHELSGHGTSETGS